MNEKEYYYTREFYNTAGLSPFLEHVGQYLRGERTIPVSKTISEYTSSCTYFTFSDSLLDIFLKKPRDMRKPYETAIKHGFKGHSKGRKNGICYVRRGDKGLITAMDSLIAKNQKTIFSDLDIQAEGLDALRRVKIVWHNRSGERIVGVYNPQNSRILFLGFASY